MSVSENKGAPTTTDSEFNHPSVFSSGDLELDKSNDKYRSWSDFATEVRMPLIIETNRSVETPNYLHCIVLILLYLQILFGSWFLFAPRISAPSFLRLIIKILYIGLVGSFDDIFRFTVVVPGITIVSGFVLFCLFFLFKQRKLVEKWHIVLLRMWYGVISPLMIAPQMCSFVDALGIWAFEKTTVSIVALILNMIAVVVLAYQMCAMTIPLSKNPYLSQLTAMMWQPEKFYMGYVALVLPISLGRVVYERNNWSAYIPYVLTLFASFIAFERFGYVPFSYCAGNSFFMALPVMVLTTQVFNIFRQAGLYMGDTAYFTVTSIVWILVVVASFVIFVRIRKSVAKKLCYSELGDTRRLTHDKKMEYIRENLPNRKRLIFFVLQVGLEECSELFIDWSLIKNYLLKYSSDQDIITFCTWLVCFFPSESALFHALINTCQHVKGMSSINVMMFNQLYRAYLFRENATSPEAIRDFERVRAMSDDCAAIISNFWKKASKGDSEIDETICDYLGYYLKRTDDAWGEMLDKYPNNSLIASEYSTYLLDGRCDFKKSLLWNKRAGDIENGQKTRKDKMFQRFIRMFPNYLKRGLVDVSGKLTEMNAPRLVSPRNVSNHGSSYGNTKGTASTGSDGSDGTICLDTEKANAFLPRAALRVAFERYVNTSQAKVVNTWRILAAVKFLFSMVVIVTSFALILTMDDRKGVIASTFQFIDASEDILLLRQCLSRFQQMAFFDTVKLEEISNLLPEICSRLNLSSPIEATLVNLSQRSFEDLDGLSKTFYVTQAAMEFGRVMTVQDVDMHLCKNGAIQMLDSKSSIDGVLRWLVSKGVSLSKKNKNQILGFLEDDDFCNAWELGNQLANMTETVASYFAPELSATLKIPPMSGFHDSVSGMEERSNNIMAITPFIMIFMMVPFVIYVTESVRTKRNKMLIGMMSAPRDMCLHAAERMGRGIPSNRSMRIPRRANSWRCSGITYDIVITIVIIVVIEAICMIKLVYSNNIDSIVQDCNVMNLGRTYAFDMVRYVTYYVFARQIETEGLLGKTFNTETGEWVDTMLRRIPYMTSDQCNKEIQQNIRKFRAVQELRTYGSGGVRSSSFWNSIESLWHDSLCNPYEAIAYTNHPMPETNYYQCVSFDRVVSYLVERVLYISKGVEHIRIDDPVVIELVHLLTTRISDGYKQLLNMFMAIPDKLQTALLVTTYVALAFAIILEVTVLLADIYEIMCSIREFGILKSLFLRLDPMSVVVSESLMETISEENESKDKISTACQLVFQTTSDAIIGVSSRGVIESSNNRILDLFGCVLDQVLGQPLSLLIDKEGNEQLYYHMQLMASGQCELVYSTEGVGTRDNGSSFPIRITLLGLSTTGRAADSLYLMCRDIEGHEKLKTKIDETKKQSDHIMEMILPVKMIRRSRENQKTFVVNECCILVADIAGFSAYAESTGPKIAMQHLSRIFRSFDKLCSSLDAITKVDQNSDMYIVIGGLFDEPSACSQITLLAMEMLQAMEELNIELSCNLHLRIGINTDGPIIAGLMGNHNGVVFHVIGKAIQRTIDLEKSCPIGFAHISRSSYEGAAKGPYEFTEQADGTYIMATAMMAAPPDHVHEDVDHLFGTIPI